MIVSGHPGLSQPTERYSQSHRYQFKVVHSSPKPWESLLEILRKTKAGFLSILQKATVKSRTTATVYEEGNILEGRLEKQKVTVGFLITLQGPKSNELCLLIYLRACQVLGLGFPLLVIRFLTQFSSIQNIYCASMQAHTFQIFLFFPLRKCGCFA